MDETQNSRLSDAAATRKRRSSILKSQRAPRTPFSELEFNVATPTDAGKSRRVSFSRRTGVAEFVTNEATTTWKNFYEEHNKSLESSGNESGAKVARPSISHIGKRIFDQQFEEVEAVDFESALMPGNSRAAEFNLSINNVNLTQQLAAFDCSVDDKKLTAPQQHFELSSLTDHQSKVFSDEFTIQGMGEMSNQINVNFSTMKPMGMNDKCDDLDEIQKDLERSHNVVCPGPFREQNMSGYIEVDLNMTHVAVANDESDMSITDTVHSPKVQAVTSSIPASKRQTVADDDWMAQKENIAVLNPYVAPRETDNFAINEEPDQVLVFDGKRLTVQTEKKEIPVEANEYRKDQGNYRQTLLPDAPVENAPQRKTIVLNINDDLPNFGDDRFLLHRKDVTSISAQELKHTMIFDEGDLSMTQAVQNIIKPLDANELTSKQPSVCENTMGNISLTQPVRNNILLDNKTCAKRKTIIYDDSHGNMSVTQALSANVLLDNKSDVVNKRRTTIYESKNVSFTEVVPPNLILPENNEKSSNKTIMFQNNMEDISFTQALPNNIQLEKFEINNTGFERSACNISMTQVVPSNIFFSDNDLVSNRRKTIVYDNDAADISMTQAIPTNLILTEKSQTDECVNKSKTAVFENETGDISLTRALLTNIIEPEVSNNPDIDIGSHRSNEKFLSDDLKEDDNATVMANSVDTSINTSKIVPHKRLTIMYDEHADISMTQALPANILSTNLLLEPDQRKSVVFDNATGDLSMTQAIPSNILYKEENVALQSLVYENKDLCTTQIASNTSNLGNKSIVVDNNDSKNTTSTTNEVKHHMSPNTKQVMEMKDTGNGEIGNMSMSKPIPHKIFDIENEVLKADMEKFTNMTQFGEKTLLQDTFCDKSNVDIIVYQANTKDTSELQINKTDHNDFEDEESKETMEVEKLDSTTTRSVKSLTTCDNSEVLQENDFDMQTSQSGDLMPDNIEEQNVNSKLLDNKEEKSILHELLDMSSTSVLDDNANKNVIAQVDTEILGEKCMKSTENNSVDAMFIIAGDTDETNQTEKDNYVEENSAVTILNVETIDEVENKPVPALECKTENENNLEEKICQLRRSINEEKTRSLPQNRYYEQIVSADLQASFNNEVKDISDIKDTKTRKSFKEADDTKELLEILSDFTDRKSVLPVKEEKESHKKLRSSLAIEHKTEPIDRSEPKRLSFAPNRQSIVLTREELLNNLSMAQATLQQSRFDIEDSEVDDTATESPTEINESINSPSKSVRMSNEVVKTLQFEDESCSDLSLKSDLKLTPLKKTAFGETSYMRDTKANVIPTYLKDVSDNIKALMSDLVKPRPDQMPFEVISLPKTRKDTSTCSTQIQANLITSSQIDLDVELHSNVNSVYEFNKPDCLMADIADMGILAAVRAPRGRVSDVAAVSDNDVGNKSGVKYYPGNSTLKKNQEPVLVFDHSNPLNNILLAPITGNVHKYNPVNTSNALRTEDNTQSVDETKKGNQCEVERVITQYNVESLVGLQSGDTCPDKKADSHSLSSDPSKPLSMDRSTEGIAMEVKSTEVNTVIAMKGNNELLEASSSLTLVDDALMQNVFEIKVETRLNETKSPVKLLYKIDDEDASMQENIDSDIVSNDDEPMGTDVYQKAKKRSYSPSRRDVTRSSSVSSPNVTPKPASKMQKISTSPNVHSAMDNQKDSTEKCDKTDSNSDKIETHKKRSSRKSKSSPKHKKPGTDVTVQQLITEYKISKMEQDMIEDQIIEALHDRMSFNRSALTVHKIGCSPGAVSCTSSKDQDEMQEVCVKETVSYVGSQPSRVDWQPDMKELSSSNLLTECDSGVNVVAKIDMLPFMGSKECEWETSGGDTWVFRLLRARLRLRVRLAHRHHNALRTRVCADTPVTEISVDAVPVEEKDPLAALCVRFAAEAMRYECGRGCARAGAVPAVLRRCGGVARVALRWARAMRDARARLAYTLTPDGVLTLKVANIPLRSVWEVRARLELVVEDAREVAWPRAGDVCVRAVLSDCALEPDEATRVLQPLQHDWGHVPRAIWKIFRHLKNKTREDNFLSL